MAESERKVKMAEKEPSLNTTPAPQESSLRRWSFFFTYLLFFPLLLQLLFGAFSFSAGEWLNGLSGVIFRGALCGIFIFSALHLPRRAAPFLMGAVSVTAGIFNLLDIFLLVNFGSLFDYNIFQTARIAPKEEIRGFMQLFFMRVSTWVILLLYPAAGIIIFKLKKKKLLWGALALFTAGVMFFFNVSARESSSPLPSPTVRMKNFVHSWQVTRRQLQMEKAFSKEITAENSDPEALYILVIGESHSRRRSSLYGFPRETTPGLKKLYSQKKLFRFDNGVTPHVMTYLALPGLLTLAGSDGAHFTRYPSLPDIFRRAGFKVWYIYNQMPDKESALPFLTAAKRADHFISLSNPRKEHDLQILPEVEKIFRSPAQKKLLILHLRGNHWKYADTFPEEMRHFSRTPGKSSKENILNEYDDSLRALDHFLCKLIQKIEKQKCNALLLYLADHGESLYEEDDFVGHTDLFPTAATAEIPLFLWLSDTFPRPELRKKITKSLNRPFLSSDLPHFFMELAGIKTAVFAPERSLINPLYKEMPRRVSTRGKDYRSMKNRSTPPTSEQR